ncbi:hypothetical protein MA16_Dca009314 [Dendrobium catenatum]|uniref:Uncharacterized protein n=1 Tax=Dendrobium catenatum TaxID=906689 RepID=A0A2I0WZ09_9ASPA|nr:hypothetical protein MA16_Dca009314 [Dendrobium catenatum]
MNPHESKTKTYKTKRGKQPETTKNTNSIETTTLEGKKHNRQMVESPPMRHAKDTSSTTDPIRKKTNNKSKKEESTQKKLFLFVFSPPFTILLERIITTM